MGERTLCRRARRNTHLVITGLGVSIPLAIFGSTVLLWLLAHNADPGVGRRGAARLSSP
jgi:hypothetical protein